MYPPNVETDLEVVRKTLGLGEKKFPVGIILGTGWDACIPKTNRSRCPLSSLPSFKDLGNLKGHARELVVTKIGGKKIIALNGRIHLNESPCNPQVYRMVRLQGEIMCSLAEKLIITNSAGRLTRHYKVGDVMAVESFYTLHAPFMPLWAGEHFAPDSIIDKELVNAFYYKIAPKAGIIPHHGCYAMVLGPWFEGLVDKNSLRRKEANAVGMSTLPEACIAALPKYEVPILPLSFISNTEEEHSHEQNIARANAARPKLKKLLRELVTHIVSNNPST